MRATRDARRKFPAERHGELLDTAVQICADEGLSAVTLRRVAHRVAHGGHQVPEEKVRARYARLWSHVATASRAADRTRYYDNSTAAEPFRLVATLEHGIGRSAAQWPTWTPAVLRDK